MLEFWRVVNTYIYIYMYAYVHGVLRAVFGDMDANVSPI